MSNYNFENVKNNIIKDVDEKRMAGEGAIVSVCGKVVFDFNYGYADIENGYKITNESIYRLASMTKPVTAVAVLICEQKGLLSIDDYIDKYLPEYGELYVADKFNRPAKELGAFRITIKQILSHSSGVGSWFNGGTQYASLNKDQIKDLKTAVDNYAKFNLAFIPGTTSAYSPIIGFDILARIVEIVSGKGYGEFLKENIFNPLGMKNTGYKYSDFNKEQRVILYNDLGGRLERSSVDPDITFGYFPVGYTGGGAGLISSKEDYLRFAEMLTQGGVYNGVEILSPLSYKKLTAPNTKVDVEDLVNKWGLGVLMRWDWGEEQVLPEGCFGWAGATGPTFWCDPKNKVSAVYMVNSSHGGAFAPHMNRFEKDVMQALNLKK